MKTIEINELAEIICTEIPDIKPELNKLSSKENIAGMIQIVVTFTRELLKTRNWGKVNWNMMLIGWIYGRGDQTIKDIIENVYVRSFNGMKNICGQFEWEILQKKIPANLYSVYLYQNK